MALLFGGMSFPLTAQAAGASTLPVADPFLVRALPYWQTCLNAYLESAYVAAMGARTMGTSQRACRTTLAVDPLPWLDTGIVIEPPLLACFPVKATDGRLTMAREKVDTTYRLLYVLPALDWLGYQRVAPLLQAAFALLVKVTEEQHDAAYNSGEHVWDSAGTVMLAFQSAEFGALAAPSTAGHFMPAVTAEVLVQIRDDFDPAPYPALTDQQVTLDEGTAETGLLPDAASAQTSVG